MMPGPPVASTTASAWNAWISIVRRSWATMPLQTPSSSWTMPRNSQNSYFVTLPSTSCAARLLVQRVQELLAGGRAGVGGAVVLGAAEAPEVQQPLAGPVEHDAHAVQQVDDAGRVVAHVLDGRLVGEKVAAVDRVVEVLVGRVALALGVDRAVDAALGADRVAALDGHEREQVHGDAGLGDLDGGHQPGQSAADDDDFGLCVAGDCRHRSCLFLMSNLRSRPAICCSRRADRRRAGG